MPAIAIVTWFFPKISETFVLNQVTMLLNAGFDVRIYALKSALKDIPKEDIYKEYINHEIIDELKILNRVNYVGSTSKLAKSLISNKSLDAIYFQFPDLAAKILTKKITIPVLCSFHDLPKVSQRNKQILQKKYREVFKLATLVMPISDYTKSILIKLGCPTNKLVTYPMGVNDNFFKNIKLKNKVSNITMVGRFVPKKGFHIGIKAFKLIIKRLRKNHLKLHIVGDGYLRKALGKLVVKLKLSDHVIFYGKLTQEQLKQVYDRTDVLLCPSITDSKGRKEGLPVVLLESAFMGIPIVASRHAAIPELVDLYSSIVLVKENNHAELAHALATVIKKYKYFKKQIDIKGDMLRMKYGNTFLQRKLVGIINKAIIVKKLQDCFKKITRNKYSFFLVGSVSRAQIMNKHSDIDLIVTIDKDNMDKDDYINIKKIITPITRLKLPLSLQVYDKTDLTQLVSPVLIKDYEQDAFWFQHPLSANANTDSKKFALSIYKRAMFLRYQFRQKVLSSDGRTETIYTVAKYTFFLLKYYLWLTKKIYPTNQFELVNLWQKTYPRILSQKNFKHLLDVYLLNNFKNSKHALYEIINCYEKIYTLLVRDIECKYGKLRIDTF